MSEHAPQRSSEFLLPTDTEHAVELYRQNPRGLPETWGAVPLGTSRDIQLQQNIVHDMQANYFKDENVPDYVPAQVAEYIENVHMSRVYNRESKNTMSYTLRGNFDFERLDSPLFDEILQDGLTGHASPAELLFLQKYLKLPSVELGSLTHPYHEPLLYPNISDMRLSTRQAIVMHGGIVFDDASIEQDYTRYEVKGADRMDDMKQARGLHMTRKRTLGMLPDNSYVIERSSFIVLLDVLPESCQNDIRSIQFEGNDAWYRQVLAVNKFYDHVANLLKNDVFEVAVPLSTTIVSINDALDEELTSKKAVRERSTLVMHRLGSTASNRLAGQTESSLN